MTKTYFMEMEVTLEMVLWRIDHPVRQHTQLWHFLNDSKRTVFCTKSCINTEQKKTGLMEEDPQNLATKALLERKHADFIQFFGKMLLFFLLQKI